MDFDNLHQLFCSFLAPAVFRYFVEQNLSLHRFQFLAHLFRKLRQLEEPVPWGDDRFLHLRIVFGYEIHRPPPDLHLSMTGESGYFVQYAADKECASVAPAFPGVDFMDGVGGAPDVALECQPCLLLLFFLRPCGFPLLSDGLEYLVTPVPKFFVTVLIAFVRFLLFVVIESAPSGHHRVDAAVRGRRVVPTVSAGRW